MGELNGGRLCSERERCPFICWFEEMERVEAERAGEHWDCVELEDKFSLYDRNLREEWLDLGELKTLSALEDLLPGIKRLRA